MGRVIHFKEKYVTCKANEFGISAKTKLLKVAFLHVFNIKTFCKISVREL